MRSDGLALEGERRQQVLTWAKLQQVLTDRELEVLKMVARGMSNAEIADELTISPATAKTHVAHLLTKLDARDRIQLVIIAYQSGLARC
jgi:DNA-binding NarL/FixJ family response regulator